MPALILTNDDVAELNALVQDFRHKEAAALISFLRQVAARHKPPQAPAPENVPATNGHDAPEARPN